MIWLATKFTGRRTKSENPALHKTLIISRKVERTRRLVALLLFEITCFCTWSKRDFISTNCGCEGGSDTGKYNERQWIAGYFTSQVVVLFSGACGWNCSGEMVNVEVLVKKKHVSFEKSQASSLIQNNFWSSDSTCMSALKKCKTSTQNRKPRLKVKQ